MKLLSAVGFALACRIFLYAQQPVVLHPEEPAPAPAATLANSDPNYRALRDGVPKEAIAVQNLVLKRDTATITLSSGKITFQAPVLGRRAMAVFTGQGMFHLSPVVQAEQDHLVLATGKKTIDEEFDSALLVFSDGTYEEVKKNGAAVEPDHEAARVFTDIRKRLRTRNDETWRPVC